MKATNSLSDEWSFLNQKTDIISGRKQITYKKMHAPGNNAKSTAALYTWETMDKTTYYQGFMSPTGPAVQFRIFSPGFRKTLL